MNRLCVYCGSSPGKSPDYTDAAKSLAAALVDRNIGLVYGGANVGIMGQIADAVIACGGEVTGIMPQFLVDKEVAHHGLTDLKIVHSMHERKSLMEDLAEGFIALPGGLGTLEELFEVLTWAQLGFHKKPCALLNIRNYYDHLAVFLDHALEEQFIQPSHRNMLLVDDDPSRLLNAMEDYQSPMSALEALNGKWIGRDKT